MNNNLSIKPKEEDNKIIRKKSNRDQQVFSLNSPVNPTSYVQRRQNRFK